MKQANLVLLLAVAVIFVFIKLSQRKTSYAVDAAGINGGLE